MKKRRLIPSVGVVENFKIAMHKEHLSVAQLAAKAGVHRGSIYRYFKVGNIQVASKQCLQVGVALGFSEKEIRDRIPRDPRLDKYRPRTKRERALELISDLVQLF